MAPSEGNVYLRNLGGLPVPPITPTTPRFPGQHVQIGIPIESINGVANTSPTFVRNVAAQHMQPRLQPQRPSSSHVNPGHTHVHASDAQHTPERPSQRYLKDQLSAALSDNAALHDAKGQLQDDNNQLQTEIQKQLRIIHDQCGGLTESKAKMDHWKSQHDILMTKASEDVSSLQAQLQLGAIVQEDRLSRIKELEQIETNLTDENANLAVCIKDLNAEKALAAQRHVDELATKQKQLEDEQKLRLECEANLKQAEDLQGTMKADLATERGANAGLQAAADQAGVKRDAAVAQEKQARADLADEKEAAQERLKAAESKRKLEQTQVKKLSAHLQALRPDLEQRKKQIGHTQYQNRLLRMKVKALDDAAKKSRALLADCVKERDEAVARISEVQEEHQLERDRAVQLSEELTQEQTQLARRCKDLTLLQQKAREQEKSLAECKKELAREQQRTTAQRQELQDLEGKLKEEEHAKERQSLALTEKDAWISGVVAKLRVLDGLQDLAQHAPPTERSQLDSKTEGKAFSSTIKSLASPFPDEPRSRPPTLPSPQSGSSTDGERAKANASARIASPRQPSNHEQEPRPETVAEFPFKLTISQKRKADASTRRSSKRRRVLDSDDSDDPD